MSVLLLAIEREGVGEHLQIKEADWCFHDCDCAIEGGDLEGELAFGDQCRKHKFQLCRVQFRGEIVCEALIRAGGDFDVVLSGCEVADIAVGARVPERAADELYTDGLRVLVDDGEDLGAVVSV